MSNVKFLTMLGIIPKMIPHVVVTWVIWKFLDHIYDAVERQKCHT